MYRSQYVCIEANTYVFKQMQVEVVREGSFDQITGELVSSREAEAAIGLPCLGMKAENFMAMAIR